MRKQTSDATDGFGPVIFRYSRARALADGVLVDVTDMAREAGFKWPVALTHAVWEDCVAWTEADSDAQGVHQDQNGRLRDVLWMALCAIRVNQTGGSELRYKLYREHPCVQAGVFRYCGGNEPHDPFPDGNPPRLTT
jgi:hypothetical protein